jgi:predicted ATP-dependent endonuclease of OLD family
MRLACRRRGDPKQRPSTGDYSDSTVLTVAGVERHGGVTIVCLSSTAKGAAMRLKTLWIKNFRCCKDVEIAVESMHALVGANNAGKSTILRALDFFFNPSTSKVNDEVFFCKDTTTEIRVEALFGDLTDAEAEAMKAQLRADGTLHLARTASYDGEAGDDDESDGKVKIGVHYNKPQPKYEWLNEPKITATRIKEWLKSPHDLEANGKSFHEKLEGKSTVEHWKTMAEAFAKDCLNDADFESTWTANPKGFPNVLKANLPHFELIPAVRDAADESKVLKTNPFGRLIYEIVKTLDTGLREDIGNKLKETIRRLNREGGDERLAHVSSVETSMKDFLGELMPADLEIEFQAPTVETLLTTPKIFIDDGFRGAIEGKGHGLQRAVIFSILRCYAKLVTARDTKEKRTLILGVEEPELYMHPTAQRTIRRVLRTIADGKDQVIFTTHSPLLVDVTYFDEIVRVEAADKKALPRTACGAKVFQLPMSRMVEDSHTRMPSHKDKITAESLRERYSHAYTATRNEGFFAKQIILVEGQTEGYCLPIYARALGHEFDTMGLAVIECGGKDQIDRLYRIFNELGIPCFILFDFDMGNPKEQPRKASRAILAFINETLTDDPTAPVIKARFACFKDTWEKDLIGEIPDYAKQIEEAAEFLGPCGKPLEARYIATKLTTRTPAFVPPTLQKMIEQAVAVTHTGTCLKCSSVNV